MEKAKERISLAPRFAKVFHPSWMEYVPPVHDGIVDVRHQIKKLVHQEGLSQKPFFTLSFRCRPESSYCGIKDWMPASAGMTKKGHF